MSFASSAAELSRLNLLQRDALPRSNSMSAGEKGRVSFLKTSDTNRRGSTGTTNATKDLDQNSKSSGPIYKGHYKHNIIQSLSKSNLTQSLSSLKETNKEETECMIADDASTSSTHENVQPEAVDDSRKDIDGGYAWVVLACAFMLNVFMSGQFGTLGIYLVEYMHHFGVNKQRITYVGACQMFFGYFLGIFNGALMKRFGLRVVVIVSSFMVSTGYVVSAFFPYLYVLYVFYGVMSGIGFLNFYLAAIVSVQQYFDKKRAFATGVCTSGLSLGIFVWSPFTRYLIDKFNWQGALLIQAGIFLNGIICGLLLRPAPPRKKTPALRSISESSSSSDIDLHAQQTAGESRFAKLSCGRMLPFYLFLFGYFCIQLGHMTLYAYMPVKCDGIGLDSTKASFLVSLMGITGIFARPVLGLIGDRSWSNRTCLIGISALVVGVGTMISTQLLTYIPLAIFSTLFGFFSSGYMALYGAALVDIVNLDNIAIATGALMGAKGLSNLMLHLVSGWLMDMTGDVNVPFLVFGLMQALGGLLIIPIPWIQKCLKRIAARKMDTTIESNLFT